MRREERGRLRCQCQCQGNTEERKPRPVKIPHTFRPLHNHSKFHSNPSFFVLALMDGTFSMAFGFFFFGGLAFPLLALSFLSTTSFKILFHILPGLKTLSAKPIPQIFYTARHSQSQKGEKQTFWARQQEGKGEYRLWFG